MASVVVVPLGFVESGYALFTPPALAACGHAIKCPAVAARHLRLETPAARRLRRADERRARHDAIAGLLVLGETLGGLQWVGIAAITVACAGSGILSARQSRTSIATSLVT